MCWNYEMAPWVVGGEDSKVGVATRALDGRTIEIDKGESRCPWMMVLGMRGMRGEICNIPSHQCGGLIALGYHFLSFEEKA